MNKNIGTLKLKAGDILLFPTKTRMDNPVYKYVSKIFGEVVADFLWNHVDYEYGHSEIYYGAGYGLGSMSNGSRFGQYDLSLLSNLTILRHKENVDEPKMRNSIEKFWNNPYDYDSLMRNTLTEILNILYLEEIIEDMWDIDTPKENICSEIIARIYDDYGLDFTDKEEWISPMDILKNENFEIIYKP